MVESGSESATQLSGDEVGIHGAEQHASAQLQFGGGALTEVNLFSIPSDLEPGTGSSNVSQAL